MFCDACGTANRDEARFCRGCGMALTGGDATPTEAAPTREVKDRVPPEVRTALQEGYEVLRPLGLGGMGTVYLARELALDRLVAVKVLRQELASSERNVTRFLQEARLAAKLRHPGIVSIHAVGSHGNLHFFTMDYLDGLTLDGYVRREESGRLDPARARPLLADVARAVGHAHRQGLVHRDLKPSNIMLDESGRVFVLDFGLAKPVGSGPLTTAGTVVGTPQYVSPEQIDGRPATPRSDVYALGLVYYFLLTGEHLVQGDSLSAMVAFHLSGSGRARVAGDSRLPAAERPLLLAMLDRREEGRPASMEDVIRALTERPDLTALEKAHLSQERPGAGEPTAPVTPVPPARAQMRQRLGPLLDKLGGKKG